MPRNKQDWTQAKFDAIAHPRLRQYIRTKIKTDAYNCKLLDFCALLISNMNYKFWGLTVTLKPGVVETPLRGTSMSVELVFSY